MWVPVLRQLLCIRYPMARLTSPSNGQTAVRHRCASLRSVRRCSPFTSNVRPRRAGHRAICSSSRHTQAQLGAIGNIHGQLRFKRLWLRRTLAIAHHQPAVPIRSSWSVLETNFQAFLADPPTCHGPVLLARLRPRVALLAGLHITLAMSAESRKFTAPFCRRPNQSVKRTNIGGAHLLASLASSAPLFAAYLLR